MLQAESIGVTHHFAGLGEVLATHRGPSLAPIVDALEAAGFVVQRSGAPSTSRASPSIVMRCTLMRAPTFGGRRSPTSTPSMARWVIARGSVNEPWYGRPHRPGHHPWGYGPAPTGAVLVAFLRTLLVDDVAEIGGAR